MLPFDKMTTTNRKDITIKMTKNRIIALLLAGLMTTAAMTSCRVQGNNDNPQGTEPNQNGSSQTTTVKPDDPYTPPTITWSDVDKLVFAAGEIDLLEEANKNSKKLGAIPVEAELHCIKQNTSWYLVEYDGKQGYVSKTSGCLTYFLKYRIIA